MKHVELARKTKSSSHWTRLAAVSLLAVAALAGCGGGSDGAAGAPGAPGAAGTPGAPGKDLTAVTVVSANTAAATLESAAAWKALAPQVTVTSVTINSPPVVKFTVKDASGKPLVGLANYSQSSTATVKGLTNVAFTLAKLVPGTNNEPSKWVSYNVLKPVTVAQAAGTIASTDSCNKTATTAATWCGTYPTTDAQGTLVDKGDGSYEYTFYRDPKQVAVLAASLTDSVDGLSKKADFGDLSFDATLTHRLGIQIGGAAPGTGSNNPTASSTGAPASVNMVNTANVVYDFRPDGAAVANSRDVVKIGSCSSCHDGKVLAHGSRKDPNYCVTCHTDQIKYSFSMEAPASGYTLTGGVTGSTQVKRAEQAIVDGRAVGNFPNFMHKLHMGGNLVKQGYNYNANGGAMLFNNNAFPQAVNNCTTCHDGSATATNKTTNGDNWKGVPSILACGSCHDGINFTTGQGVTLANKAADIAAGKAIGTTATGHVGGAKANNALCILCHDAATNTVNHATPYVSPHNLTAQAGLKNFKYEISSASQATAGGDVTVVFKITMDGTAVSYLPAAAAMANPLTGFTGSPGFLLAYAKTQDGVTTPIDYNNLGNGSANAQPKSVSIANLLDTAKAATSGTLTGPDGSGYYTATIKGTNVFPVGAKLRTVALQGYFTQISPAAGRHTLSVVKMVGTDTARRSVVEPNKCGNCHEVFEGHGGNRNIGLGSEGIVVCVVCHNPGIVTSGRGIADAALAAFPFTAAENTLLLNWGVTKTAVNAALSFPQVSNNFKDMIHGIHAGKDRTNPIRIARDRTPSAINLIDGANIEFPGNLNNCESCHKAGTYSAVPANTLLTTMEADNNSVVLTGLSRTPADAKAALSQPNATDKVTTPFTAACVSCHDGAVAKAHMATQGGQILVARSAANLAGEACAVCHAAGKPEDPAVVHK